jgi:hypothetical protein
MVRRESCHGGIWLRAIPPNARWVNQSVVPRAMVANAESSRTNGFGARGKQRRQDPCQTAFPTHVPDVSLYVVEFHNLHRESSRTTESKHFRTKLAHRAPSRVLALLVVKSVAAKGVSSRNRRLAAVGALSLWCVTHQKWCRDAPCPSSFNRSFRVRDGFEQASRNAMDGTHAQRRGNSRLVRLLIARHRSADLQGRRHEGVTPDDDLCFRFFAR